CDVIGVDPSSGLLEQATKKYPSIPFVQAHAEELPFKDHEFNVVVSLTAIQNFSDINQALKEMRRVGTNQFALTYLKRSPKGTTIDQAVKKIFLHCTIRRIEEEKDIIYIIKE
ncbi:MAG TPA: methyltransferase domain-containing protein, partial [Candidatus Nanoarchaeia archaeon]|nr:methyltransferase domain-containing protein [Candidatus Nanoarchaeia archaeon]